MIVVQKLRPQAGTLRLGYLVNAATWWPQYRLRGSAADGPVRLEYLAALVQQTGESWSGVRITLSTARPSLDAAPPDLTPLKMDVPETGYAGPIDAHDSRSERIIAELAKPISMPFAAETPLTEVIKFIKSSTRGATLPEGIPIYVDPIGLSEADKTMQSTVRDLAVEGVPLRTTLRLLLSQLGLTYRVSDGLLKITSEESAEQAEQGRFSGDDPMMAGIGAMGGMGGGTGLSLEQAQAFGQARLNQAATRSSGE